MTRGEIEGRIDVNFWRLTPLFEERFRCPCYPVEPLGSLVSLVQYGSSSLATETPEGVPMLRMNNLQDDGWDLGELKYIELSEDDLERYRVAPGDLLFNRTNSKELVGKCAVFEERGDWVFASYLIRVRLRPGTVLPEFAADFLSTRAGRLQIDRLSRQIIGMTNINAEELKEILLPVPPPAEQRRLVSAMDGARASRRARLAHADALLDGLGDYLLHALHLTAPAKDDRKVFAIPSASTRPRLDPHFHAPPFAQIQSMLRSTSSEPLANVVTFSTETWNPRGHKAPAFRYIEINGVDPRTGEATWTAVPTSQAPSRARMLVREGDIIVSLTRPHHGSIALLGREFDGCVASTGFAIIREVANRVRRDYLWCVLRAQFCLQQMLQRASGGNYPAITEAELAKVLVPVPDLATQEAVADEGRRRQTEARRLRAEANEHWYSAKQWFEEQVLGGVQR